jgi:hypothetical protein
MSTAPLSSGEPELGDEPAQLQQLADVVEAYLHRAQKEAEQDTQTLKQVQGDIVEQRRIAKKEKVSFQVKFEVEKAHMQQEKEQLLAEQLKVEESVKRALHSIKVLEL